MKNLISLFLMFSICICNSCLLLAQHAGSYCHYEPNEDVPHNHTSGTSMRPHGDIFTPDKTLRTLVVFVVFTDRVDNDHPTWPYDGGTPFLQTSLYIDFNSYYIAVTRISSLNR